MLGPLAKLAPVARLAAHPAALALRVSRATPTLPPIGDGPLREDLSDTEWTACGPSTRPALEEGLIGNTTSYLTKSRIINYYDR